MFEYLSKVHAGFSLSLILSKECCDAVLLLLIPMYIFLCRVVPVQSLVRYLSIIAIASQNIYVCHARAKDENFHICRVDTSSR